MPPIIQHLTSISPYSPRSGAPPSRRLLALLLCAMLVFGSILPGFAAAGEVDSEGEGTTPPIEVPVGPPDFDPGGEETGLEEEGPDSGAEEEGAGVEAEAEVEIEVPAPETTAPTEAPVEIAPPPPAPAPETATSTAPASEPESQKFAGSSETVMNQSITAPAQERGGDSSGTASATVEEVEPPPPAEEEAPQPVATPPAEPGRDLGGKGTYVVRPGDCLWHIAAAVLPAGSDTRAVEDKVEELWRLNDDRIGTGDPNLIYPGTVLRLR